MLRALPWQILDIHYLYLLLFKSINLIAGELLLKNIAFHQILPGIESCPPHVKQTKWQVICIPV